MVGGIFFVLILILALIKILTHYEEKKRLSKLPNQIELKTKQEIENRKLEALERNKNNLYKYDNWDKIIDGSETIDIDKTNISSQILLDNWDFISKYY